MTQLTFTPHTKLRLRGHPLFTETWVRDRIFENPSILGLGDLEVKDRERIQPGSGRLDLLLIDYEEDRRYVVELMLGEVDASHITRTLEYWDNERKRYSMYDHKAVIIAEGFQRYRHVLALLNERFPLIVLQMNALTVGNHLVLDFTPVFHEVMAAVDDEDRAAEDLEFTRDYWVKRSAEQQVRLVERMLGMLHTLNPQLALTWKKFYIGIAEDGRPRNFVTFSPKRDFVRVQARADDWQTWATLLEDAGLKVLEGGRGRGWLLFRVDDSLEQSPAKKVVMDLFRAVHDERLGARNPEEPDAA